jgi:haloacetate dehalogenase
LAYYQVEVMRALGHATFAGVGHDRGARTAHRMALDHPEVVERVAVLDIVPTRHVYGTAYKRLAETYYHWFFLIQPYDLPEHLIDGDPTYYLHHALGSFGSGLDAYDPRALVEYERCFAAPMTRHAICEDYRAAASIDLVHDEADAGRRITAPTLVLWGARGAVGALYEPLEVWRDYADDVDGRAIDAGHFLVDERPDEVTDVSSVESWEPSVPARATGGTPAPYHTQGRMPRPQRNSAPKCVPSNLADWMCARW